MADAAKVLTPQEQIELADRLKTKWLMHMEHLLDTKVITSTDLATLCRLLLANGWSLDAKQLPRGLRDKLTKNVDPSKFEDDDADVFPITRAARS